MNLHYTHTKFRISAYVAEFIKLTGISAAAAKLLFALIFLQDQADEGWPGINEDQEPQGHFVLVTELRGLGFPAKTRSSRFLRKPVEELTAATGVFNHLTIVQNGRYLTWRFAKNFFYAMADMNTYGLIDVSEIKLCRGRFGGALLAQIPLNRRKRVPEFRLIGPNKGFECKDGLAPPNLVPSQIERQLRPSLQSWANATGMTFAVLLVQEGECPGFSELLIRIKHKDTKWPKGRFTQRSPSTQVWEVRPEATEFVDYSSVLSPQSPPFS